MVVSDPSPLDSGAKSQAGFLEAGRRLGGEVWEPRLADGMLTTVPVD